MYTWAMSVVRTPKTKHTKSLLATGFVSVVAGVLLLFTARYLAINYILRNSSSIDRWYKLSHNAGVGIFWLGLVLVAVYLTRVFTKKQ